MLCSEWFNEWQYIQHRSVCRACTQTWKNNGHFIFGSSFNRLCYQCARPRRWRSNHAVWILNVVNIPRGKKFKQPLLFTWTGNYTIAEIYLVPRALNFDGLISCYISTFLAGNVTTFFVWLLLPRPIMGHTSNTPTLVGWILGLGGWPPKRVSTWLRPAVHSLK